MDRRSWEIKPFEPLPFLGDKFDLITAFMVNFDRLKERDYAPWGQEEWEFFLANIAENYLNLGGRLVLLLNPHTRANAPVLKYFADRGATLKDNWVEFQNLAVAKQATPVH